jgi:hypothetical protein
MTRDVGIWIVAVGGAVLAFGLLRLYSVLFADPAAAADIKAQEGGVWLYAVAGGIALMVVGWLLRRMNRPA